MNEVYQPLPDDDPVMVAWNLYKTTEDYANTLKWAAYKEHRVGSLWACFLEGWRLHERLMEKKL